MDLQYEICLQAEYRIIRGSRLKVGKCKKIELGPFASESAEKNQITIICLIFSNLIKAIRFNQAECLYLLVAG